MQSAVFQVRFVLREREHLFYPDMNILNFNVNAGTIVGDSYVKQFNLTCPVVYEYSPSGLIVADEISVKRTAFPSASTPFGYLLRVDSEGADNLLYNQEFLVRSVTVTKIIQEANNSRQDGISYFAFKPFLVRPYKTDLISFPPLGFKGTRLSYGTTDSTFSRTFAVISAVFLSYVSPRRIDRIIDYSTMVDMRRKNNTILHIISSPTTSEPKRAIHEIDDIYAIEFELRYTNQFVAFYPEPVYIEQKFLISQKGYLYVEDSLFGVGIEYQGNVNLIDIGGVTTPYGRITIG